MSDRETLTRRQFFARGATAALGLGAAGCDTADPYALEKPPVPGAERWRRFEEKSIATACGQCEAGCGVRVRVVEGRAVKIAGESDNPINRGGIGPRGLAGLQALYDPDRIKQPLRRKGPRGAGEWEPVSWESALEELTARLARLRERSQPERAAILCGRERGLMRELWERFARAYGTPNFFDGSSRGSSAFGQARYLMQGTRDIPAYDWSTTRYVLSIGAGVLEASCQSISFARGVGRLKRGRGLGRGKLVQVEPSYSRTAASSDEWISIVPGTYAAFVLGIAHALVRDASYDRDFVAQRCTGFEDWTDAAGRSHAGFRSVLLEEYAPEQVAGICGVEAQTLERIARELSASRPAFAITDSRATSASNGLHTAMAVHALNALLGSLERPGGVVTQQPAPLADWPAFEPDAVARAGLAAPRLDLAGSQRFPHAATVIEELPNALISNRPYRPDTLLLYYANPCYAWMNPARWREALAKVPFIASFTPFLDETAEAVADLILPDHTYLERWEDAAPAPSAGPPVFGIRQPVVEPLHDTRASGDVVIELAQRLGEPSASAFPWKRFRDAVFTRAVGLHAAGRGSIQEQSAKKFLARLVEDGFWTDPGYPFEQWDTAFPTPSGKFEFVSQHLLSSPRAQAPRGPGEDPARDCMPRYDAPHWAGSADAYPLLLEPFKRGTYAEGSGANLPLLQELVTQPGGARWDTTAELHPRSARPLGIADGDRIEVESPAGRVEVRVSVDDRVREGSLRFPQGGGHTAFGRYAKGRGANVLELLVPGFDPLGGFPALVGTRVRARRIET